jgi:predicted ATPase
MQSMLAEILVDAYTNYNVHFIIETHSEYIIRKLQLLVANKEVKNSDISLLYVYDEKNKPGYEPQVKKIGIRKDGMLNGNFGEGFFDEADMLSMFLLTAQGGEDE